MTTPPAIHPHYRHPLSVIGLGRGRYLLRPEGCLGTCGFHPAPWTAVYVTARSRTHALAKGRSKVWE